MDRMSWTFVLIYCSTVFSRASAVSPSMTCTSGKTIEIGHNTSFTINWSDFNSSVLVNLTWSPHSAVSMPAHVFLNASEDVLNSSSIVVHVQGLAAGKVTVNFATNEGDEEIQNAVKNAQASVDVVHSKQLMIFNAVIGWIYFVAWSVSFYPQVFENYRRKSVVGLNFDFLAYNLTGFFAYGLFNVGMYWIPVVKDEFKKEHPHSVNPVQPNDVAFTIHATAITAFTIFQCFIYKRGTQRVSYVARCLLAGAWLMVGIALFIAIAHKITWLFYLSLFSYIKLGVTLIKYVPQALMNYRRKSTEGWSIGNVLLDFTGGSLSMLQMLLMGYNYNDWNTIFNDPTKFGLGLFSVLFDILFIIQHYCLYRPYRGYTSIPPVNSDLRS